VTRDSDTTFKVKRSKVNLQGRADRGGLPYSLFCVGITQQMAARGPPREEWDGAAAKEEAVWNSKFPRDYYEKPPLQGFYYTPTPGLIQQYE